MGIGVMDLCRPQSLDRLSLHVHTTTLPITASPVLNHTIISRRTYCTLLSVWSWTIIALSVSQPWRTILAKSQSTPPSFAHPIEAEFARILDYYGIEWEYEPRTFALQWDDEGKVTEAFSPDFYLVHEDLYVELTTIRPKLITRKNRKLRRMGELYPDINIKLFKRSDLRDMMIKYGMDDHAAKIVGTRAQKNDS